MLAKMLYVISKFRPEVARWPVEIQSRSWITSDGVVLNGCCLEGDGPFDLLVVHGLLGHMASPGIKAAAISLTRHGDVHMLDLRGHGSSGGSCTLGNKEALDVATAVAAIRRDKPLIVIGFSLGAIAAIRSAALFEVPDAVVAVSPLAGWDGPRRRGSRRTSLIWKVPGGRFALASLTGVRLARWQDCESPLDVIHKIAPAPVLIVHGTDDDFFPPSEAEALHAAACEPRDIWMIEAGGHAEVLFTTPGRRPDQIRVDGFIDELMSKVGGLLSCRT